MFRLFAVTERNPCVRCGPSQFLSAYIFAVKVSTIMAKRLLTILLLSTAAMLASQAQNADGRIGTCMNEGRWFDLAHELNVTPADSVNPILYKMAVAMTHHYFNRPDSACTVLGDLLNNHQEELGDNTLSMAPRGVYLPIPPPFPWGREPVAALRCGHRWVLLPGFLLPCVSGLWCRSSRRWADGLRAGPCVSSRLSVPARPVSVIH